MTRVITKLKRKINSKNWSIQYWMLKKMMNEPIIEYCIDNRLLDDYYNNDDHEYYGSD